MTTITEAAKILKVSRQTIYNKIDKCDLHRFLHDTDKGKVISKEGMDVLKTILFPANESANGRQNAANDSKYIDTLVDTLKAENEHLRRQVENLTRLIENGQHIQKQQSDRIFVLESPKTEVTEPKRGLFAMFKKS